MHWTALLAKREFPPHARLIDDLSCIGCGYNLRGAAVGGKCPECGLEVHASLFELAQPERAASGFRLVARSYLVHYALIVPLLFPQFIGMNMFLLVGVFMLLAAVMRFTGQVTLGYRASLGRLPIIGPRLRGQVVIGGFELLSLLVLYIMWLWFEWNPPLFISTEVLWKKIIGGTWLGVSLLGLFWAGWSSLALASLLEYQVCRRELVIQQVLLLTSPIMALVLMLLGLLLVMTGGYTIGSTVVIGAGVIGLLVIWSFVIGYTTTALLRLAGAAEQEHDTMEHLVDLEREALPVPRADRPAQSDIKLE